MSCGGRGWEEVEECPGLRGDNKYGSGCRDNTFLCDSANILILFRERSYCRRIWGYLKLLYAGFPVDRPFGEGTLGLR